MKNSAAQKTIAITGAGSDIGREACCTLAAMGGKVYALDLVQTALDALAADYAHTNGASGNDPSRVHMVGSNTSLQPKTCGGTYAASRSALSRLLCVVVVPRDDG